MRLPTTTRLSSSNRTVRPTNGRSAVAGGKVDDNQEAADKTVSRRDTVERDKMGDPIVDLLSTEGSNQAATTADFEPTVIPM